MDKTTTSKDITVRGGIINVPPANRSIQGDRHKPDTPRIKKTVTTKSDHTHANQPPTDTPTKTKRKTPKGPNDEPATTS